MNNINIIRQIAEDIQREADELKAKTRSQYEDGQLLAYAEALSIMQSACSGYNLTALKLDFDVDQRYLLS